MSAKYAHTTVVAQWLNVPLVVVSQSLIVEKANKCLDFTVTVIFIRLMVVWLNFEWPGQWGFWMHEVLWATITCLLSEALCMKLESREIPLAINDLLEQSANKAKKLVGKLQ